jgi:hypothetical protein
MRATSHHTAAIGLVSVAVLALSGCGGSTSAGVASQSPKPASTSASSSATTPSSTPTPSGTASSGGLLAPAPSGYTYTTVPAEFLQLQKAMSDTGMVTSSEGQGVQNAAGKDVAVIVGFQYNAKLTPSLDKLPADKVLDGSVKGAKASMSGAVTSTSLVSGGTHIRVLGSPKLTIAVAYQDGGHLYEVFGPNKRDVTAFVTAYFAQG